MVKMGSSGWVTERIIGESLSDVEQVIKENEKNDCIRTPTFRDTRELGFRGYINIKVKKAGEDEL
jgi:hypothetical protein